jgi:glycosyl transferase family 25
MKKFVINLKRRPDRLQQFHQRCPYPYTDIEIVYGFDGKNPSEESKKEQKIFSMLPQRLQPGARGVWISHLRIWKKMVDQGVPVAMVFEDDALFTDNFSEKMEKVLASLPTDGILYFGGRFVPNFVIPDGYFTYVNEHICQSNFKNLSNVYHERTIHGYIITLKVAKLFIEIFNNTPAPDAIDQFMIHTLRVLNIPVYNSIPLLCHSPMVGDSDIR